MKNISKIFVSVLICLFAHSLIFAQDYAYMRSRMLKHADESVVRQYIEFSENRNTARFFAMYDELIILDKRIKEDGEKTDAYKRILAMFTDRLEELANSGDKKARAILLAFNIASKSPNAEYKKELFRIADEGDGFASFAVIKLEERKGPLAGTINDATKKRYVENAAMLGINYALSIMMKPTASNEEIALFMHVINNLHEGNLTPILNYDLFRIAITRIKLKDPINLGKGLELLNLLASKGYMRANVTLYLLYSQTDNPELFNPELAEKIKAEAEKTNAGGFYQEMASIYNSSGGELNEILKIKKNVKKYDEYMQKAADAGNSYATYNNALKILGHMQNPRSDYQMPKENLKKASLKEQKKALELFEKIDFIKGRRSAVPYAAIYLIGHPKLRNTDKGLEILNKCAAANPYDLIALYLMAKQGVFMPQSDEKAAEYLTMLEVKWQNSDTYYEIIADALSGLKSDNYYAYFAKPDIAAAIELYQKYPSQTSIIRFEEFARKHMEAGEFEKAQKYIDMLPPEKAFSIKLNYARKKKDKNLFFISVKEALENNVPMKHNIGVLSLYFALSLTGQNPYMENPEDAKTQIDALINNAPEWMKGKDESDTEHPSYIGKFLNYLSMRLDGNYTSEKFGIPKSPKLAALYLQKSADMGNKRDLLKIAENFMSGKNGFEYNPEKGIEYVKRYLNAKPDDTHFFYSHIFNEMLARDSKSMLDLYEYAANFGNTYALATLSFFYEDGVLVKKDEEKAKTYMDKALECPDKESLSTILESLLQKSAYTNDIFLKNDNRTLELLFKLAELGYGSKLISLYAGKNSFSIDFDKVSVKVPHMEFLKEIYSKEKRNRNFYIESFPDAVTDEIFKIAMLSESPSIYSTYGELIICFEKGIGGFKKNQENADALKNKIKNIDKKNMFSREISYYIYGGTFIKTDLPKAVQMIEDKGNLSQEDLNQLESIKQALEENYKLRERVSDLFQKVQSQKN